MNGWLAAIADGSLGTMGFVIPKRFGGLMNGHSRLKGRALSFFGFTASIPTAHRG